MNIDPTAIHILIIAYSDPVEAASFFSEERAVLLPDLENAAGFLQQESLAEIKNIRTPNCQIKLLPRGIAHVVALLNAPLPEQQWVSPLTKAE